MLELKDITIQINGSSIVTDFSLIVNEGEMVALVCDDNISEKGLLLQAVLGFVPLNNGFISLNGELIDASSVSYLRRYISYLPQNYILKMMKVSEIFDIMMSMRANTGKQISKQGLFRDWDVLGLDHSFFEKDTEEISISALQKVMLSLTACVRKYVMLLDNPTNMQDEVSSQVISEYLRLKADNGMAILVATSDDVLIDKCDRKIQI